MTIWADAALDATVQRWAAVVGLVIGVLTLVVMIYKVVRRIDRALARVEGTADRVETQVRPNGLAHAVGAADETMNDLLVRNTVDTAAARADLESLAKLADKREVANERRHTENKTSLTQLTIGMQTHLDVADRLKAEVLGRLAALEALDERPPRLSPEDD
jgi:uncharacterized protein YoxC